MEYVRYVCMCLARGGVGGEWIGFYQSRENRGSESVSWLRWCGWVVGRGLGPGSEGWDGVVCVSCESEFSV